MEIANEVLVALVSVALVAKRFPAVNAVDDAYGNTENAVVEVEKNTPIVQIDELVAEVVVLKVEV